jgi:hypothetical protein
MQTAYKSQNLETCKQAPMEAFLFDAHVRFGAAGKSQGKSKDVELLARTGDAIEHWYWGMMAHDMAGLKSKPVVALDWCHGPELVGKADRFDVSTGDLVVRGSIESIEPGDLADQIIRRSERGIPYEASIYFDPWTLVLEYLPEGLAATVNGRLIDGPCVIAREWNLRRIALCPSGADGGTEARFSAATASVAAFNLKWSNSVSKSNVPATGSDATKKRHSFASCFKAAQGKTKRDSSQKAVARNGEKVNFASCFHAAANPAKKSN